MFLEGVNCKPPKEIIYYMLASEFGWDKDKVDGLSREYIDDLLLVKNIITKHNGFRKQSNGNN